LAAKGAIVDVLVHVDGGAAGPKDDDGERGRDGRLDPPADGNDRDDKDGGDGGQLTGDDSVAGVGKNGTAGAGGVRVVERAP